jgi:hypothetical protein
MDLKISVLALAGCLGAVGTAAWAQSDAGISSPATPPAPPKPAATPPPAKPGSGPIALPKGPPAELEELKMFVGSWRCEGEAPANALGAERKYLALAKVTLVLDDMWIRVDYEQRRSRENPTPQKLLMHWSYDVAAKNFHRSSQSNLGTWDDAESPGWAGDTWTWTGEAGGLAGKLPFRSTMTRRGLKEVTLSTEYKIGQQWIPIGTDVCRK